MSKKKKIILGVILVFLVLQFIRPERNINMDSQVEILSILIVPPDVHEVLTNSCYDCHSNNTRYPWYSNIQPAGWLLSRHIKNGKAVLNFNEFSTYSDRRKTSKLKSVLNSIKDGSMPLPSYTWLHSKAKLSAKDKSLVQYWISNTVDSLSAKRKSE